MQRDLYIDLFVVMFRLCTLQLRTWMELNRKSHEVCTLR